MQAFQKNAKAHLVCVKAYVKPYIFVYDKVLKRSAKKNAKKQLDKIKSLCGELRLTVRVFNSKWRLYTSRKYQTYCTKTIEKTISQLDSSE